MDTSSSIIFDKLCNGGSDFPSYASCVMLFSGNAEPVHVATKYIPLYDALLIQLLIFRKGNCLELFQTKLPKSPRATYCDGKSIVITDGVSRVGKIISYENGYYKEERVCLPEGSVHFIRSVDANYFIVRNGNIGFALATSASAMPLLTWNEPNSKQFFHFCIHDFILLVAFEGCTRITKYVLVDGAFSTIDHVAVPFKAIRSDVVGDNYVVFIGSCDLAIFDSASMEIVRFKFSPVPLHGSIVNLAARLGVNGLVEIYFSVKNDADCNIYKASLSRHELEARIAAQQAHKQHQPMILDNAECEEKENDEMGVLKATVAALQTRLEKVEGKYINTLLALSKK